VAIDSSGDAWIADESSGAIVKLSNAGVAQSGSTGYTAAVLSTPTGIAIDHSGNVWVSNSGGTNGSVVEISSTGGLVSSSTGYTNSALGNPGAIAIDGAGNAWVADPNTISEISPTGTFLSGSTGFTVSNGYNSIGIDGSGDVVLNYDVYNFQYTNPFYYMQVMVGAATPVVTPVSLAAKNNTLGTTP
jgi:sugar lactone lactonase YvrE